MTTREATHQYRLAQWAQILQAKAQSGESITEFCESAGISRNTYFYWQRKLRETACTELARIERGADKGLAPSGWARLESSVPIPAEAGVTIEVGGCRITATSETDTELLAKVCRMLKTL